MKKTVSTALSIFLLTGFVAVTALPFTDAEAASISADQAKEIALHHAGVAANEAHFQKVKFDYDDRRQNYDVEFVAGGTEYDYEIDANTGSIISFDSEVKHGHYRNSASVGDIISADQAKQIAFDHARTTANDVRFVKVKQDHEDGRLIYEIKFYIGFTEHEYEIDAVTGNIISYDVD